VASTDAPLSKAAPVVTPLSAAKTSADAESAPQPVAVSAQPTETPALPDVTGPTEKVAAADKTAAARSGEAKTTAAELVERVANAVQTASQQQRPLRVRLHPPELGVLQVEIVHRGGHVSARLEVQTAAAQQALTDSLPALREALAQHGSTVTRLDVQLVEPSGTDGRLDRGGHHFGGSSRQDSHEPDRRDQPAEPRDRSPDTPGAKPKTPQARRGTLSGLDVQV
jgi:flagellar hook-length control protein FliK